MSGPSQGYQQPVQQPQSSDKGGSGSGYGNPYGGMGYGMGLSAGNSSRHGQFGQTAIGNYQGNPAARGIPGTQMPGSQWGQPYTPPAAATDPNQAWVPGGFGGAFTPPPPGQSTMGIFGDTANRVDEFGRRY